MEEIKKELQELERAGMEIENAKSVAYALYFALQADSDVVPKRLSGCADTLAVKLDEVSNLLQKIIENTYHGIREGKA